MKLGLLFGIWLAASQAGMLGCQNPALRLPADATQPSQRIRELLEEPRGSRFPEAIRLVRSIGQAAAPVAWELHDSYRGVITRRLQCIVLAAVAEEDPASLLRGVQRAAIEDRMLACLVLGALERDTPAEILPLVGGADRLPLRLAVAALAVAPRGANCERLPESDRDDAGIVAAACLSGNVLESDLRPWLAQNRRRPHADLVLRGVFLGQLGSGQPVSEAVLGAAWKEFETSSRPQAVREAAALLLGSRGLLQNRREIPPAELLWHGAAAADLLGRTSPCSWLGWEKWKVLEDFSPGAPGRLAVCYARNQPVGNVLASMDESLMVPVVADDIALALAMRRLREVGAPAAEARQAASTQDLRPHRSWLAWVEGAVAAPMPGSGDERLDEAARLAADGRLPPGAAARVIEDALWMRGSHPRLAVREAWLSLVRDLLLSGSAEGPSHTPETPGHERYALRNLQKSDLWFEVAAQAWSVLSPRALPMPERHRLR